MEIKFFNIIHLLGYRLTNRLGMLIDRSHTYLRYIILFLKPLIRYHSRVFIVDLGCGSGWFTRKLTELSTPASVIGTDLRVHPHWFNKQEIVEFEAADAPYLPFRSHSVDSLILISLLEHVTDWKRVLFEAYKALRSGGMLIIQLPNLEWIIEIHTGFPLLKFMPNIVKTLVLHATGNADLQLDCTPNNVTYELKKVGFRILGIVHHYHSGMPYIIKILPAPSYFIIALKR